MNASVSSALERLQADLLEGVANPAAFLDAHRADVEVVLTEKSVSLLADLLGMAPSTLKSWCTRRGVKAPRQYLKKVPKAKAASEKTLSESVQYWQGMAYAYREAMLALMEKS